MTATVSTSMASSAARTAGRSVAQKMGLRAGWRTHVVGAPAGVLDTLGLPVLDVAPRLVGEFDYLHLFARTRAELREQLPVLLPHLAAAGKLWVSWPKGRRPDSDLSLPSVIDIGYSAGLVESTCLRVDDVWAGLRFTRPRPGKLYANSYGTLPAGGSAGQATAGAGCGEVGAPS